MPTYQYACTECGHAFEQFQSFSDDALTECPECAGRLRKLFNAVGVVFKGSGFYRNDSRGTTASTETSAATSSRLGRRRGRHGHEDRDEEVRDTSDEARQKAAREHGRRQRSPPPRSTSLLAG